jgi:hypothetical protein
MFYIFILLFSVSSYSSSTLESHNIKVRNLIFNGISQSGYHYYIKSENATKTRDNHYNLNDITGTIFFEHDNYLNWYALEANGNNEKIECSGKVLMYLHSKIQAYSMADNMIMSTNDPIQTANNVICEIQNIVVLSDICDSYKDRLRFRGNVYAVLR